jgi:hypothetical protein
MKRQTWYRAVQTNSRKAERIQRDVTTYSSPAMKRKFGQVKLRRSKRLGHAVIVTAALVTPLWAQRYTPPPPPLTNGPCVPTKDFPCATPATTAPAPAAQFPFPGEPGTPSSTPANPAAPMTTDHPFPGEPSNKQSTPATNQYPSQTGNAHPFPGEPAETPSNSSPDNSHPFPGEPPADTPGGTDASSASSSGSSSSSSSSSSDSSGSSSSDSSSAPSKPAGSTRFLRRQLPKVQQSPSDREAEDLDVSRFYLDSGDFAGSYLRAQDAVKYAPDDSEAHFALAQSAARVQKPTEAIAEYKLYLKMDPGGAHIDAATAALKKLSPKS